LPLRYRTHVSAPVRRLPAVITAAARALLPASTASALAAPQSSAAGSPTAWRLHARSASRYGICGPIATRRFHHAGSSMVVIVFVSLANSCEG
jgi:hypothetical protein